MELVLSMKFVNILCHKKHKKIVYGPITFNEVCEHFVSQET